MFKGDVTHVTIFNDNFPGLFLRIFVCLGGGGGDRQRGPFCETNGTHCAMWQLNDAVTYQ